MERQEVEQINFLEKNLISLKIIIGKLKFSDQDSQQLLSMALFCTIYEMTTACMILFRNKNYSAIPVLLRNILEAHIDLLNLSKDEFYYNYMNVAYLNERNNLLKLACESKDNKFLEGLSNQVDICEKYKESKIELEEIKEKGYCVLGVKKRFKKANSLDIYLSIYNLLCQDTHNNISTLGMRHYNKETGEITIFKNPENGDMLPYLDSLNGVLLVSCQCIYKILSIEEDEKFKKLINDFGKVRDND